MFKHKINVNSETWKAVEEYIEKIVAEDRIMRELPNTDIRKLDRLLGGIRRLERLRKLPIERALKAKEKEHRSESEGSSGFGIQAPSKNF